MIIEGDQVLLRSGFFFDLGRRGIPFSLSLRVCFSHSLST